MVATCVPVRSNLLFCTRADAACTETCLLGTERQLMMQKDKPDSDYSEQCLAKLAPTPPPPLLDGSTEVPCFSAPWPWYKRALRYVLP